VNLFSWVWQQPLSLHPGGGGPMGHQLLSGRPLSLLLLPPQFQKHFNHPYRLPQQKSSRFPSAVAYPPRRPEPRPDDSDRKSSVFAISSPFLVLPGLCRIASGAPQVLVRFDLPFGSTEALCLRLTFRPRCFRLKRFPQSPFTTKSISSQR